jgi:uncharacterized protein (TIGR02271 family)
MASANQQVAVGVFDSHAQAQQAVNELRRLGFREDQIGVAGKHAEAISGAGTMEDVAKASGAGLAAGAATGAGLGALWGLGIVAGVLPAIGPAIAGGTLATILSSAAAGAAGLGLVGALTGLGMSSEEADYYEGEFKAGRYLVTVTAHTRYDEAVTALRRFGASDRLNRTAGSDPQTVYVPVRQEEVFERRPVVGGKVTATGIEANQNLRIPVTEEQVHLEKRPVVKEEVKIDPKCDVNARSDKNVGR